MVSNKINAENGDASGSEDTYTNTKVVLNPMFCWLGSNMLMVDQ